MMTKTRLRKAKLLGCVLMLVSSFVVAQTRNEFTVKQTVDYGLKNAVQVKNTLLDILVQEQSNREVTSAAYPRINATGAFNDYLNIPTSLLPGEFFGGAPGSFIPVKFGTKYSSSAGVSLNQILFDGQVFVGLQARKTSIDFRKKAAEVTAENIKANIYKVYYQLVVGKTQVELLDANIGRLKKLDHDTREIYKNGFAEKLDIDKLTVQIANLETEKMKVLNNITYGYNGLKVLIGMPFKDSLILTDSLSDDEIKTGVLAASEYKYNERKDFQLLELNSKLNEYNIKRYKLSQIPTLNFNANYSKQAQRSKFDFLKGGDWFTTSYIGLNLSIPIFNGFSTKAKIAQSKLELQQTQNQIEGLKLTIDNEVESGKNNFNVATATMDNQKKNMVLAELVYEQTKKKYEVGTGSATEINTAQVDLKTAQSNYINSLYDAIIAKVDLLKALGKL
jgi:outer membrane protein TolC